MEIACLIKQLTDSISALREAIYAEMKESECEPISIDTISDLMKILLIGGQTDIVRSYLKKYNAANISQIDKDDYESLARDIFTAYDVLGYKLTERI